MEMVVVVLSSLVAVLYGLGAIMAAAFLGQYSHSVSWGRAAAWPFVIARELFRAESK